MSKVVQEAFEKHESGGWNINREYAQFCIDHDLNLQDALKRAKTEYSLRPGNIDVLDTYAWALYKTGNAKDAAPIIEQALRLGTKNSSYQYHAAMIYNAVGDRQKALAYLQDSMNDGLFLNAGYFQSAKTMMASLAEKPQNTSGSGSLAAAVSK